MIRDNLINFNLIDNSNEVDINLIDNSQELVVEIRESTITNYRELQNKPKINGIELEGNMTTKDLGIDSDINYMYDQTEASDKWVIVHNLNKYPAVSIINSAGEEVIGDVFYNSLNQVTITFEGAFKGRAILN